MHRLGRLLVQRIALIVMLLTPGTLSTLTQQVAAEAAAQRATTDVVAHQPATLGQPPESTAQSANTPTPSGAYAPFPDNHSFDAANTSLGSLTTNADFETAEAPVGTPPTNDDLGAASQVVGTPPANADFEAPPASVGTPPTNANFETGDFTGWATGNGPAMWWDASHGHWPHLGDNQSVTSSPFTVDANAQYFAFDVRWVGSIFAPGLKVYLLHGPNYATSDQIYFNNCPGCDYWQTLSLSTAAYLNQSVKLQFVGYFGSVGIDNVRMEQPLAGYDVSGGVWRDPGNGDAHAVIPSGTLTTSAFTVDTAAQAVAFDVGYFSSGGAGYHVDALSGAGFGTVTPIADAVCSGCSGWATVTAALSAYTGQSIKLRFSRTVGTIGIDDIRQEILVPGYTTTGNTLRSTESGGNVYARIEDGSLISAPFTVDSSAQLASIRIKGFGSTPQYEIDVLSGSGFTTSTMVTAGYGNTSQWETVQLGLGSWAGQQIKLKIRALWPTIGVDDVGLQSTVFPGWQTTGTPYRIDDGSGNHYASTNGNLTSAPLTVPNDAQQFSLRARDGGNSTFYVNLLSGLNFSQTTQLGYFSGDPNSWQTLKFALQDYAGQTIEIQVQQSFGRGLYDDIGLGETVVPSWYLSGQGAVTAGADAHGTFVQSFAPDGTFALESSMIDIGTVAQSGSQSARYYAISYEADFGPADILKVSWISPEAGTNNIIFQGGAASPTGVVTEYIPVNDLFGERGYFRVYFANGGKIYSLGDNIARQQMTEPFSQKVGLQVDTSTGSFGESEQDLTVQGALPLSLTRYYAGQSDHLGTLGYHWSTTYDTRLIPDDGNGAGVVFGSGAEEFFIYSTVSQVYRPADARTHDALVKNGDGSYTFTTKSNLTYAFTASGTLTSMSDLNGNAITLAHDANGYLTTVTDPAGQALTFAYDTNDRLASVTDPVGAVVTYGYDANGDLSTVTDPTNGVRTYHYDQHRLTDVVDQNGKTLFANTFDANDRVISQTDALGKTITIDYDTPGQGATAVTDPKQETATYYFDRFQRTTDKVDPAGQVISYLYDGTGNLQKIIDPAQNQWQFAFDTDADLTGTTDPLGNPIAITYNPQHLPTTVEDARGNVTTLAYDANGNVTSSTDPLNKVTTYTYDAHGFLASTTNPLNQTETYTNDTQGRRLSRTDALGHTWSWTYDYAGRMTSETDPNGHTTTYVYDLAGRPLLITDALGHDLQFLFDPAGHLIMAEDELGRQTFWGYDDRGLVISKTDPAGKITTYTYDDNRNMTAVTDPLGHTTSYGYDASNRLTSVTNPLNETTTYTYDAAGHLASQTDPLGRVTTYGYDDAGHLTSLTLPNTGVYTFTYDADGNRLTVTDPLLHTTTYTYDELSRQTSVSDPLNQTTTDGYDDAGRLAQTVNALNQTTTYGYDAAGRLTAITDALSHTTSYGYDDAGNRTTVTDPLNHTTTSSFDALNRLTSVTDPLSHTTSYTFDDGGQLTGVTDPLSHTTSYAYNLRGLLSSVTDPLNRVTSYGYDDAGRRISSTNPRNATTSYGYDAANELTSITDALSGTVSFGYDAAGQQTSVTNPRGKTSSTTYDALGNVLTTTDPLNRTTTNTYDLAGQLTSTVDPNTTAVGYSYDAAGNLSGITDPGGSISYGFDALNRQTSMTDATGTTNWSYDANSQTTQVASPEGTIGYGYDAAGEQTSMTLPGSRTVNYGYDPAGNMTSLTDWQSQQVDFGYDAAGQQTSITRPNGVTTGTTYDAAGQTSTITHHDASSTLESFSYAYDDAGNRISVLTAAGTESYTFDLLNRLTEVDYANGDIVTYGYDANGNRLTQTVNGVTSTATYDDADQLTDLDGTTSSYDANGNLTAQGSDTFAWNWNNQLTSATVNGTTADYTYDGDGNRVSASTGGTTTNYLWDDSSGLSSLVDDGANAYLSANGLQAAIDGSGATSYALDDALGSVRGLTDSSGTLTGSTNYDAFGSVRSQTGSTLPLGYTGELTDPTTAFLDLRARDLDPTLGRFLSRDSVSPNAPGSQGYNPYAYVANNPTTWVDPSGHDAMAGALPAPGVTGEMVADAAMLIAVRSASMLTGAVCALHLCTAEGVLLLFAVGVLVCYFDTSSACWTDATSYANALYHYGSAAAAGAWSYGVSTLSAATVESPVLPHISAPSSGPEPEKTEVPVLPPTDNTTPDGNECRALAANLRISQKVQQHIEQHHGLNSTKAKDRFSMNWAGIEELIRLAVLSPSSRVHVDGNECVFEYDAGLAVGFDPAGLIPRTIIRVVMVLNQVGAEPPGSVVTAYPISSYDAPRQP